MSMALRTRLLYWWHHDLLSSSAQIARNTYCKGVAFKPLDQRLEQAEAAMLE